MSEKRDITLQWKDPNIIEKGYKVYRSKEPMDINNMPEAIASLEKNSTEYIDKDQTIGDTNYYRVSAWIDGHEVYSKEVEIKVTDDTVFWEEEASVERFFNRLEYKGSDVEVRNVPIDSNYFSIYFGPSGTYPNRRTEDKEIRFTMDVTGINGIRLDTASTDGTGYVGVDVDETNVLLESHTHNQGGSNQSRGTYLSSFSTSNNALTGMTGLVTISVYAYLHSSIQPETYVYNIEFF